VCVHPDDERYKQLVGKKAIIPIVNREVPIIADTYIDKEFGTGCLKVTPAHDINDYELGKKYGLQVIDIMNPNGTLTTEAGKYAGVDRFKVRKEIAKELEELGYLVKVEDHVNKVGFSERTDAVIEPRLSLQWFVKMKDLSKPALDNVVNGNIKFHPAKFINTYKHWMENIKDWCISRQLWWGHRIPAYYFGTGANDYVVARSIEEALEKAKSKSGNASLTANELTQDEDVLDTWFSSWLWPISVFDPELIKNGKSKANTDLNYYYPTNDLVTAPEIMFFWVARMIISGYEYMGNLPFRNVYYTGIVRDKLGRKMSKQLGNSPDPLDLIEKYGADGVRVGMLFSSPAGNDLLFDSQYCEQGRNFCNKIWNALRLVKGWQVTETIQPDSAKVACDWFEQRLNVALTEINDHFDKFRISDALIAMYKLIWDDFCSWYLEMVKPGFEAPVDKVTYDKTIGYFEKLAIIKHPFMPFISEEIWHALKPRHGKDYCIVAKWPEVNKTDQTILDKFAVVEEIVTSVRNIRKEKNISFKVSIDLKIAGPVDSLFDPVIVKLCNIKSLERVVEKPKNAFSFIVKSAEFFIPFTEQIDVASEKAALKQELEYVKGFLKMVDKKLSNERFVSGAPANVLQLERQKQSDALAKIRLIEEKLASLN
ncbi:MAG TPA: valine--tRNA ligase, partial [Flavobacteriales bacterium]|nr:valine--tRNA ligase [Flavobacteriales bacterium]